MDRRKFLMHTSLAGLGLGLCPALFGRSNLLQAPSSYLRNDLILSDQSGIWLEEENGNVYVNIAVRLGKIVWKNGKKWVSWVVQKFKEIFRAGWFKRFLEWLGWRIADYTFVRVTDEAVKFFKEGTSNNREEFFSFCEAYPQSGSSINVTLKNDYSRGMTYGFWGENGYGWYERYLSPGQSYTPKYQKVIGLCANPRSNPRYALVLEGGDFPMSLIFDS